MPTPAIPCVAATINNGRNPRSGRYRRAAAEQLMPAISMTGRRFPIRSASEPQLGPAMTRSSDARPKICPIAVAFRPRSANHNGRNAVLIAEAENSAAKNSATRTPSDMPRASRRALQRSQFADLARHRGDAVTPVGGQRLQ